MSWVCRLSNEAAKQVRRLPKGHQRLVAGSLDEMEEDPLRGDVRPIKAGRFKGALRKRVGHYRIVFAVDAALRTADVAAIPGAGNGRTGRDVGGA